jgi:hypothetical protein
LSSDPPWFYGIFRKRANLAWAKSALILPQNVIIGARL